jgi:uncharacterized protein (DUF983 family)
MHRHPIWTLADVGTYATVVQCPDCGQLELWGAVEDDHGLCRASTRCDLCGERTEHADDSDRAAVDLGATVGLVGRSELAGRAHVAAATVDAWRRRHPDFPAPVTTINGAPVWVWAQVASWLSRERRPGRPRS